MLNPRRGTMSPVELVTTIIYAINGSHSPDRVPANYR